MTIGTDLDAAAQLAAANIGNLIDNAIHAGTLDLDADRLAGELKALALAAADHRLASLGGELLAEHGPNAAHPNPSLATLGGYLLGHTPEPNLYVGADPEAQQ